MKKLWIIATALFYIQILPLWAQDVIWYTGIPPLHLEKAQEMARQRGINLTTLGGSTGTLLRRIEAESDAPAANLFGDVGIASLKPFEQFFQPYSSPELAAMAEGTRYAQDRLQPIFLDFSVIMVNTNQLDGLEKPTSWADLAKPEWKGRIVVSNPENSSTSYGILYGLSKLLDEETYRAIVTNIEMTQGFTDVLRAVAEGEYSVGFNHEPHVYAYIAGGREDIEMVYPLEGTFMTKEYIGLVKNDHNLDAAKQVLDILLSKDFLTELAITHFRRSARTDIDIHALHPILPPYDTIKVFSFDEVEAAANRDAFLAEWQRLRN